MLPVALTNELLLYAVIVILYVVSDDRVEKVTGPVASWVQVQPELIIVCDAVAIFLYSYVDAPVTLVH